MNSETYIVVYVVNNEIIEVLWAGNKVRAGQLAEEFIARAHRNKHHSDEYQVGAFRLTGTPPKCEECYDWISD
jgi:hypothetical protein